MSGDSQAAQTSRPTAISATTVFRSFVPSVRPLTVNVHSPRMNASRLPRDPPFSIAMPITATTGQMRMRGRISPRSRA